MTTVTPVDVTGSAPIAPVPVADKQVYNNSGGQNQTPQEETKTAQPSQEEQAIKAKFAILARNQQKLRAQQRALEEQRRSIESERKEIEQVKVWKDRIKQDPYGVMLEQGLTSDQVASLMLNQPNPMDQNMLLLKQELDQTRAKLAAIEQHQTQSVDVQREAARKQILHDVKEVIGQDESFEAIRTYGDTAAQAVVALIEETFDTDGYIMNTDDAIKEVEEYLVDEALKVARLKKVQSRLYPAKAEPTLPQKTQPNQKITNTLSNRMVQTPTTDNLTSKQRRERAIAAFQGRLK